MALAMSRDSGGLILLLVGAIFLLPSLGHFTGATQRAQGWERVMGGPQGFHRRRRGNGGATDEGGPPDDTPIGNGNGGPPNGGPLNGLLNGRPRGRGRGRRMGGPAGIINGDLELGRLEAHITGASKREKGIQRVMGGPQGFRRSRRLGQRLSLVGGPAQREM